MRQARYIECTWEIESVWTNLIGKHYRRYNSGRLGAKEKITLN
jgi:hypothetical protein